jgi:cold-inducible RNA-binding protein
MEEMMQQNKLYVGNLPYTFGEAQLEEIFSPYGDIEEIKLIRDRDSGRSKGFAFITFVTQHAAENALEQNGKEMSGQTLKVNIAKEKPARGGKGSWNKRSRW